MKKKKWYRLDNSGKIFPPIMNSYDTCVFRVSCSLKENIDKNILQESLEKTLKDFPVYNSVLRRGFFWYYIEEVDNIRKVREEETAPCDNINGILYRVTYFKNRINLEVNHCLTDASGATVFLKCMVANYLKLKYNLENAEEVDNSSTFEKSEDAFKKYYKSFKKHKRGFLKRGYKLKGEEYDDYRIKIIEGTLSFNSFSKIYKKYDCSATVYLTSVLIKSIILQMTEREKKKPIYITVPVSLRKEFPTNTTRNFFCIMSIIYNCSGEDKLEDIISIVKTQFTKNLERENLYSKMSEMIFLESFFICRIVPRFIKNIVLKVSYDYTRLMHTMSFSNIGMISMPETYIPYIEKFSFMSSTDGMNLNLCSFEDNMVFSFSSHFLKSEVQKNFVRSLVESGIEVKIDTNELEEE